MKIDFYWFSIGTRMYGCVVIAFEGFSGSPKMNQASSSSVRSRARVVHEETSLEFHQDHEMVSSARIP
jgi:hypothetical protein